MFNKTKIEKMELYADMYRELQQYDEQFKNAVSSNTVVGFRLDDLKKISEIYKKYYPNAQIDLNCNVCVHKMIQRVGKMYLKYDK